MKEATDESRCMHQQEQVEKLSEKRNDQQTKATMTEDSKMTENNTTETKSTNIEQVSFPKITAFSGEDPKPKTEASFLSRISTLEKQLKNTEKQRWYGRNRYTPQNKYQEQKQTEETGDQKQEKLNQ